jgi:hypothetical protein
VGDQAELHLLAHALTAKPRVEHERNLIERQRPSAVARHHEQRALSRPLARAPTQVQEPFPQRQHLRRPPDARRVLLQPGNRLHPRRGAGRDHQVLVGELTSVGQVYVPEVGVNAIHSSLFGLDRLARQRLGDPEPRCRVIRTERHIDEIRPKHERVVFVHDLQIDATGEARLEQEGCLERGHSGAQHDDTRWR